MSIVIPVPSRLGLCCPLFSLPLTLSFALIFFPTLRSSSFSFSLHPTAVSSISLPLIISYLYLGPFGSQWRYLACLDWAETPPNLITQSVGRGAKEVAMAVSLHTACTFRSTSLGNSHRASPHPIIFLPPILIPFPIFVPLIPSVFLCLFLCPFAPSLPPTKAGTDIEGLNHWQSDSNYE